MTEIYLVRHGQASFGEKVYDNLSKLGLEQGFLLGKYFKKINVNFDKAYVGTLRRQVQTFEQIKKSFNISLNCEQSSLLNEYDVKSVLSGFVEGRNLTNDELYDKKVHFNLLRNAVDAWSEDKITYDVSETWKEFSDRARNFLNLIGDINSKSILVVSSGGTISMLLKQILDMPSTQFVNFHFQIYNSSFSKIKLNEFGLSLSLFNSIAHLDNENNDQLITYV